MKDRKRSPRRIGRPAASPDQPQSVSRLAHADDNSRHTAEQTTEIPGRIELAALTDEVAPPESRSRLSEGTAETSHISHQKPQASASGTQQPPKAILKDTRCEVSGNPRVRTIVLGGGDSSARRQWAFRLLFSPELSGATNCNDVVLGGSEVSVPPEP